MSSIKHKFLVMSSKGGVGKTSVIVNLALALSMKGMKVGLMDLNYNSPEIHKLFGLELFSTGPGNRAVFLGFYITIFLWICTKRRQWKPLKSSWTGFVSNR